jgi:glycosyltransferase involved in cell wall biosynthesis
MYRVLLLGPSLNIHNASYGAGKGGYTRNMEMYLRVYQFSDIELHPFFATVRRKHSINWLSFPLRFLTDTVCLTSKLIWNRYDVIHILGQYRSAVYREVAWIAISKFLKKKVIYEIKAGQFISSIPNNGFKRSLYSFLLKRSDHLLVEGRIYQSFLSEHWRISSTYFPNVVDIKDMLEVRRVRKTNDKLRVLFVGYAYEGKGILTALESLKQVTFPVEFVVVGGESSQFVEYMNGYRPGRNVSIIRHGVQDHSFVLREMMKSDVYLYPTQHEGEGHNNSINEALMNEMIIVSSKKGFLEEVLKGVAFLLEAVDPVEIAKTLNWIYDNFDEARQVGREGRLKLKREYTSDVAKPILERVYRNLIS